MAQKKLPDLELFAKVYENILTSRYVDLFEQDYTSRGEAFFHVSGSGHENIAFLHPYLIADDFLHCHYRDKSLMIARGISAKMFFLSLFAKDQSHSKGRQMSAHLSDPALNVMSLVGPVGNNALQAVGAAAQIKSKKTNPIVLCAMGDGTTQQGEVLEAVAHAVRDSLPVLFMIEDNHYAISVKTPGRTFYSYPEGDASEFYGIPIVRINGKDPVETYEKLGAVVTKMRTDRKPSIVVFEVERLNNHTNADDQRSYRSPEEIEKARNTADPVKILENLLVENGFPKEKIEALHAKVKAQVEQESIEAQDSPEPEPNFDAKAPIPAHLTDRDQEYRGKGGDDQIVMLEALRETLKQRMQKDSRVTLFGEDLEDPKGDVFGVTRGLSQAFPGRVVNSPLAESTIIGVSIGQALAGGRPVAFLQFADFFAIGFNQIWSEMSSMHWRTDGGWKVPMIVMVSCGAFKPGLGPFHASSMEGFAAHTPGIDVFLPSTAGDAAGLLNAAFESERPTIMFYPKTCLNDRSQATSRDVSRQFVPIGKARLHRAGSQFTFVGWGNTVALCDKAAAVLEKNGVTSDVIDLRSLSPWDIEMVVASAKKTGRLIIAQEDNHTASMASEISATVAELAGTHIDIRRVDRADTWVPFHFGNQLDVLPSYKRILETAVDMLGGKMKWIKDAAPEAGIFIIEAMGSSPSDESITVTEWKVKAGDKISKGMILADAEADKAAFEMNSPAEGILEEILVPVGDMVKVGTPLLRIRTGEARVSKKPITLENPGTPELTLPTVQAKTQAVAVKTSGPVAGIAGVRAVTGSRVVPNSEMEKLCPAKSADEMVKGTGIHSRFWAAEGETSVSLAVDAAKKVLGDLKLSIHDIDAIYCSTGTPVSITPSTAALILAELSKGEAEPPLVQATDLNAACSGYLYGLQSAWDVVHFNPNAKVLVITTETLSKRIDINDPSTAPIFGDAATASVIVGAGNAALMKATIERPVLGALGEDGTILRVPLSLKDYIFMDGPKVYLAAVKYMIQMLEKALAQGNLTLNDLDLVVAHQANQRILNAVRQKTKIAEEKIYSNIANYGNTSSSSIPICLEKIFRDGKSGQTLGLCAFGGGFTFGGAILKTV